MGETERCLKEKTGLLRAMLDETRKISRLLSQNDVEGLAGAVAARRDCIEKIDALDARIRACAGQAAGGSAQASQKEIRQLLGEILEVDAANMKAAGEAAVTLMNGIREVNAERNMLRYQPAMPAGSRFVDREG